MVMSPACSNGLRTDVPKQPVSSDRSLAIFTNNTDRDNHLKSADFFNVELNPKITFSSDSLNQDISGNLTVNGVTKPIKLEVEFGGVNVDPWGNTKAGFTFEGKISRKEFGLNWNAALEAGGVMVGDDVKISGDLQFVKQAQTYLSIYHRKI